MVKSPGGAFQNALPGRPLHRIEEERCLKIGGGRGSLRGGERDDGEEKIRCAGFHGPTVEVGDETVRGSEEKCKSGFLDRLQPMESDRGRGEERKDPEARKARQAKRKVVTCLPVDTQVPKKSCWHIQCIGGGGTLGGGGAHSRSAREVVSTRLAARSAACIVVCKPTMRIVASSRDTS